MLEKTLENSLDSRASLVAQTVKNPPAMWETWVQSLGWEDPLEKEWQPTPVFLPGEFHGQTMWLQSQTQLFLGRKAMTNLESILKSKDTTPLTKVHIVKAMVFPLVMYRCDSWTIKKAECQRINAFEL